MASGESKGSHRYDKENILWQSTVAIKSDPVAPWGNCWEWTSTMRGEGLSGVKGGAFDSKRTECRTEARTESRKSSAGYPNVTFRVVREDK